MAGQLRFEWLPLRDCLLQAAAFRNANRDTVRDAGYFEWRYLRRPCAQDAMVLWAHDAGRTVAAVTVAPHDFFWRGERRLPGVVGDISVATELRGAGVGRHVLTEVSRAPGFPHGLIVAPNAAAEGVLRKAGWVTACATQRGVRPMRAAAGRGGTVASRALRYAGTAVLSGGLRFADRLHRSAGGGASLEELGDAGGLDEVWEATRTTSCFMACRDERYLSWRYLQHPDVRYRLLGLRVAGRLRGYAVVENRDTGTWVIDYLVVPGTAADLLPRLLVAQAMADDCAAQIHVEVSPGDPLATQWRTNGYMRRADGVRVLCSGGLSAAAFPPQASWYWTAGDKDV